MELNKECLRCGKTYYRKTSLSYKNWDKQRFCSKACVSIGNSHSKGHVPSLETRRLWSIKRIGQFSKEKHPNWIIDRNALKREDRRGDSAYREWRSQVWMRDKWKCKMFNTDCNGRIEAHHILSWSEYKELRYEINNGITLCSNHHPRKRIEEQTLAPILQELIRKEIF